jgi:hypothetical protein
MRKPVLSPPGSCLLLAAAVLLASPAAAILVLPGISLTPRNLPLVPLQELSVDARISIIPSGARTFAIGHDLQMETDLAGARWRTVVSVDGIPADRQSGEGRVMFISGFVLSYPTDRDVALEVAVDGAVPEEIPDATVLKIQELDNTGAPVPGSTIIVIEPVSTPPPATATTMVPVTTLPPPHPRERLSLPRPGQGTGDGLQG